MEVEDLFHNMINLFDNAAKALETEQENLSQKDLELSDLDHYLENNKLKAYEFARVGKLRQILRDERREIKNNIDILMIIKRFTDKYNNKLITGDIIQNLKEQQKAKQRQENPKYTYRTNVLERLFRRKRWKNWRFQ